MYPRTKQFDRGDHVLVITELSPTERVRNIVRKGQAAPAVTATARKPTVPCGQAAQPRLGDRIGSALESVGVTPERWAEAKAAIGLPATCNCDSRRDWINKLDEKLGLAEGLEKVKGLLGW